MRRAVIAVVALAILGVGRGARADLVDWLGETWSGPGESPDLVENAGTGQLHLAWLHSSAAQHAVFDDAGALLGEESEPAWSGEGNCWTFGPGIAAGPGDQVHLAFKTDLGDWNFDDKVTRRIGGSWEPPVMLNPGAPRGYAPQVCADGTGVGVAFSASTGNVPYAEVHYWFLDAGSVEETFLGLLPTRSDDRIDLVAGAASGERHLFAGNPDPTGTIEYASSNNGGYDWTLGGAIQAGACGGRVGQPDAALAPDGTIHLVYGCAADADLGGDPSVRHAVLSGKTVIQDGPVHSSGYLDEWHLTLGIGRVAVTGSGVPVVAFLSHDTGSLWATSSDDGGASWHSPVELASQGGDAEGRNAPSLAAIGDQVFLAYSDGNTVHLLRGDVPPPGDDDDSGDDDADDDDTSDDDTSGDDDTGGDDDGGDDDGGNDDGGDDDGGGGDGDCSCGIGGTTLGPLGLAGLTLLLCIGRRGRR